jgi:hypothetical protein
MPVVEESSSTAAKDKRRAGRAVGEVRSRAVGGRAAGGQPARRAGMLPALSG